MKKLSTYSNEFAGAESNPSEHTNGNVSGGRDRSMFKTKATNMDPSSWKSTWQQAVDKLLPNWLKKC